MRGKAAGAAGAFGNGLFRGREATAPPVKITGGAAPSPPACPASGLPAIVKFYLWSGGESSPSLRASPRVGRKEARRIGSTAGFFFLRRAEGE